MESIRLHLIDLIHSTHLLRSYSKWVEWIKSINWSRMDSIRLSLVKWSNGVLLHQHSGFKASESNGSNRSNGVELNSIRLSLVKWSNGVLLHQLRGCKASESCSSNKTPFTIWQGLVEWSPFDSIWSIWSIRLTCIKAWVLMQQDTIWPFN